MNLIKLYESEYEDASAYCYTKLGSMIVLPYYRPTIPREIDFIRLFFLYSSEYIKLFFSLKDLTSFHFIPHLILTTLVCNQILPTHSSNIEQIFFKSIKYQQTWIV